MNLNGLFPFQSYRPHQREMIEQVIEGFASYDYIFLEAPTGLGKSGIGYTVAKWVESNNELSHIVVNDKYLQDQYQRDFPNLTLMKGRGNYFCPIADNRLADRGPCVFDPDGVCEANMKPKITKEYDKYGVNIDWLNITNRCFYWDAKYNAIHSPITLQNYPYYLNEQTYAQCFSPRFYGLFDEAHTIESALMEFVKVEITQRRINYLFQTHKTKPEPPQLPPYTAAAYKEAERWVEWLETTLEKFEELRDVPLDPDIPDKRQNEILHELSTYKDKIKEMITHLKNNPYNWAVVRELEKVTFKPVTVNNYSYLLFGYTKKALLMSATILSSENLQRWLGIDEDVLTIRITKSTFPAKNRPIIKHLIGKANKENMHEYLPKVVKELDENIIPDRIRYKGVIHTHTNDTAKYILENSKYREFMISNVGHEDRSDMFQKFFDTQPPKIMVSPSMRVGVDLKDNRARWQVLIKTPYPYLGDPQIRKREHRDPEWYNLQTLISTIQTCGRICRSETDWGETLLFDSKFDDLIKRNKSILPEWFSEAIITAAEPSSLCFHSEGQ